MSRDKKGQYLISVIIPVYNVQDYLDECVQSIIDQDIGFQDNIELILVNDGSTDSSGEICRRYASQFPNIVVVDKENGGVSSARNAGIRASTANFIAFPDSDDKVSEGFYRLLHAELSKYEEVPFAAGRAKKFDAESGYHATDNKFEKTQVIDLSIVPHQIQTIQAPVLYRKSSIQNILFNEQMTHAEDSEFVSRVLLSSQSKYVVVREAVYYYRKRKDKSSATGVSKFRKTYYSSLISLVNSLTGGGADSAAKVPQFIQFALMYQLGWRMRASSQPEVLSDEEWQEYKNTLKYIVSILDNDTIMHGGASVRARERRAIFAIKYFGGVEHSADTPVVGDKYKEKLYGELAFCIHKITVVGAKINVLASTFSYGAKMLGFNLNVEVGGDRIELREALHTESFMDDKLSVMTGLKFTVPTTHSGELSVKLHDGLRAFNIPVVCSSSAGMKKKKGLADYRRLSNGTLVVYAERKVFMYSSIGLRALCTVSILSARKIATRIPKLVRRGAYKLVAITRQ